MNRTELAGSQWVTHPWVAAGQTHLRFGAGISARAPLPDWSTRLAVVRELERLGFDSHWVSDHPAGAPDCWAIMAALAVSTTTIRIGPLVDCVCYRSPALLARQAADVDRLSGGRLVLGVGCGWVEPEFGWLGLPYPPARERQRMLAEAIEIVHGLWGIVVGSGDAPDRSFRDPILGLEGPPPLIYHGTQYHLDGGLIRLGPIQSPRVPVMIAGAGERITLRQVARYADAANIGLDATPGATRTVAEIRHKLAVLRQHCEEVGRPYESILVTHFTNPVLLAESPAALAAKRDRLPATYRNAEGLFGTPDDALAFFQSLVDAGLRYFIIHLTTYDDLETAQLLATEVIPALRTPASAG